MAGKFDKFLKKWREKDASSTGDGIEISDVQAAVNSGALIITPQKQYFYASWFNPIDVAANSAYYVEQPKPALVFSATADTGVKFLINKNQIPAGTIKLKFRAEAYKAAESGGNDVVFAIQAAWMANGITPVALSTQADATVTLPSINTTVISAQSVELTILNAAGSIADDTLYIHIFRDVAPYDDLDAVAFLTMVEIEFL